jgi:hypothetical protein
MNKDKIDNDLLEQLKNIQNMSNDELLDLMSDDLPLPEQEEAAKSAISCQHEIVFKITADVLSQNHKGEIVNTVEICQKNFHIPVPIDADYKPYMHTFFKYLESNIIKTIDQTNNMENLS